MPSQRRSNQRQEVMELTAFKQYGCLPSFDFDEFKGPFDIWLKKWNVFLSLSTISLTLLEEYRCNASPKMQCRFKSPRLVTEVNNQEATCQRVNWRMESDILTLYKAAQILKSLEMASRASKPVEARRSRVASSHGVVSHRHLQTKDNRPLDVGTMVQNSASKTAVQLTENDATHGGKLVNMPQYAERKTMIIYVQFVSDRLRPILNPINQYLKSGRSMTPTLHRRHMNRHALRDPIHRKVYWLTRDEAKDIDVLRVLKQAPRSIHLRNNNNKELKQLISKFLSILDGVCRPVKGPPYHFKLRDGVVPSAVKSIDSDLLKAVRLFSSPTAVSGLRAFFSLCQEVRNLSNKVASVLKSLTYALSRSLVSTADELSDGLLSVPAKAALLCSIAGSDNKVIDLTKDSGKRQTDLDNRPRGGQVIEDDFKQLLER
ncbi:hypothetical protein T4C_2368 [Trichinella pseudospiralis]|uniref:Uncharacterized protein n=1 Tax=Trichinella pseudospiralis TaxID=6337 RepID=A0A0V1IXN5_TRIPS|nr:hypothetical protein T4C_2368 [Trichinella pseudospiralis]